jgi:hypothetical protein
MRAEDESMAESKGIEQTLQQPVFIRGQNRPFGELTRADARSRADELKAATGWGPTMRVAPVARAWRELTMKMEQAGVGTVGELDPAVITELASKLWMGTSLL